MPCNDHGNDRRGCITSLVHDQLPESSAGAMDRDAHQDRPASKEGAGASAPAQAGWLWLGGLWLLGRRRRASGDGNGP